MDRLRQWTHCWLCRDYALWDGVGETWFIGADRIQKHTLSAVRFVRKIFKDKQDNGDYTRLHANVRADWPEAIKFAKW